MADTFRLYAAGNDYPSDTCRRHVEHWQVSSYLDGIYNKANSGYVDDEWNKNFKIIPQDEWSEVAENMVFPKEYCTTTVDLCKHDEPVDPTIYILGDNDEAISFDDLLISGV